MKKIIYIFIAVSHFFTSCSNDDETIKPVLSKTEMISKAWIYEEVVHTTTTNANVSIVDIDISNEDYEQEFFADGTFVVRNDGQEYPGTWQFINNYTIHTTYDFDLNTINTTAIIKLTENEFWLSHTTYTDDNGVTTVNVFETKLIPK